MIKGNKGEWSEIYTLLKILGDGKIYAADENIQKMEELYFPVLKIIRAEKPKEIYEYDVESGTKRVIIYLNGVEAAQYGADEFEQKATELYGAIKNAHGQATFSAENTERFIAKIGCTKLKAPPLNIENEKLGKTDITMQIYDPQTGHKPISGFSIKSELGHAPTLLNASHATNFVYEVVGLSDSDIESINDINTRTKIIDRMVAIKSKCTDFSFIEVSDGTFDANLEVVDSRLSEILGYALAYYYCGEVSTCKETVEKLIIENPMYVKNPKSYYENKFKKFLISIALGMIPSKPWDGKDEASGGYILVKSDGDVLAYYIYNRDKFEDYLLNSTKFERASTTRHEFAKLYKLNDKHLINLNMQIRFIK